MEPLLENATVEVVKDLSLSRSEPEWLLNQRLEAIKLYEELPQERSPLYAKYSDLKPLDFIGVDLAPSKKSSRTPKRRQKFGSVLGDGQEKSSFLQVDDKVLHSSVDDELESKGVILTDITAALERYPELVKRYFTEKAISPKEDKFVALNHAFFNSGLFLYLPKHLVLQEPIQTLFLSASPALGVFTRNFIIADEGSALKVVEEAYSTGSAETDGHTLYSTTTEVHLGRGAEVGFGSIQNLGQNVINLVNRRAVIAMDGRINWAIGHFGGGLTRARLDSLLAGPNASTEDMEVVFANNAQKFDVVSDLTHRSQSTKGTVFVRGVLKNKSSSIFKGMIKIDEDSKKSEAYLAEHAMLLDKGARANAVPGLEIKTNDVKATHSASVALIDEEEIFYLMSRGLNHDEADRLAVLAFVEPAVRRIPSSDVRFRIWYLLERKWLGDKGKDLKLEEMIQPSEDMETISRSGPQEFFEKHYKYSGG